MRNALIIATVTAIIKNLLENSLIQQAVTTGIGEVVVTALPPDRVALGADERPQLNLYLYRLTPNSGWRRAGMPDSEMPRQEQSLALDLHYLLSTYGEHDFQAEVLLGAAIQCLQDSSNFSGNSIRAVLGSLATSKSGNVTVKALARAAQSVQLEQIRLTSEFLSLEELSKLWSSLQAHARLSVTYQASVMLSTDRSDKAAKPTYTTR